MDARVKGLWLAALRSGEYEQGQDRLHTDTGEGSEFCCLGVLCDLAVKDGAPVHVTGDGDRYYDDTPDVLPPSVMQWAGLTATAPRVTYDGDRVALTELNDGIGCAQQSFNAIADRIEADL